ncbi:MAG: hypothetical protein DRP85_06870, partial [Candidatus Makaraimicrobium thalassicum]
MRDRKRAVRAKAMDEEYYSYIKKFFGRWAPVYDITSVFLAGVRDRVVEFTAAEAGSKMLDVCTGTGKQAFAFAEKGFDVTGIDLSKDMLKVAAAKNRYENAGFKTADAADMPFEDEHFDVSCVSFGLHDMPPAAREKVLKETARVTRPGGAVTIVDYALPRNRLRRCLIYRFIRLYESKYYPGFISSDIRALLRGSGIEVEKELPVLFGAGRILKCRRNVHSGSGHSRSGYSRSG